MTRHQIPRIAPTVQAYPANADGTMPQIPSKNAGRAFNGSITPTKIMWDGIVWDVAYDDGQSRLWVVADSALVDRFMPQLTRLAQCAATWEGGLDAVRAATRKEPHRQLVPVNPDEVGQRQQHARLAQDIGSALAKSAGASAAPFYGTKQDALLAITAMVATALERGASMDDVRLAVYAGMGLDSEGLDSESAAG